MQTLDYVVLIGYFLIMVLIGWICSRRIKRQEDFFMGGRGFGKLLQTFAAFGAGTGSSDPVNTGRGVYVNGMSGMWAVMYWLFVTPFYWITGVWYRRMRHLTLGDWYVERYESKALGGAYAVFGILFMMIYGSMLFSAIGKVAAPLMGTDSINLFGNATSIEYVLVPVIGVIVLLYGIAGGLSAAYYTDLIQGLCVIVLSIILIPYGLAQLIKEFGDPAADSLAKGFTYIHEQIPETHFEILGGSSSEFPLYLIIAVVVINLIGVVVQPHFIATGGGSAKTEMNARVGLVTGNFLKRFCTIGWVITGLITLALFSNSTKLVDDPDMVWGVASKEILGPLNLGLVGLMLACLLAALMSSVDAYMVVGSGLVVRNLYAAFVNPKASEKQYIRVGRMTSVLIVAGAVIISLFMMNVFKQLELTWIFPVVFAAPFWVGMYWRRATTAAAWLTVLFSLALFFVLPMLLPKVMPDLRDKQEYTITSDFVVTTSTRPAAKSDVRKREAERARWEEANKALTDLKQDGGEAADIEAAQALVDKIGEQKPVLREGETIEETKNSGGKAILWSGGVEVVDAKGNVIQEPEKVEVSNSESEDGTKVQVLRYAEGVVLRGKGNLQIERMMFYYTGMDFSDKSDAFIKVLDFPGKIILPFVVMIFFSLITPRNSKESLDAYYAKMKTPVDPNPEIDQANLAKVLSEPEACEAKKLFPGSSLEIQKPTKLDIIGFVVSFAICFGIIALAVWVSGIGT